jgi:hypothetical protein
MAEDVNRINQEIHRLSESGVDQKKLDFSLDLQAKRYKTELRQAMKELEKRLSALREEIEKQGNFPKASSSSQEPMKTPLPKPETPPETADPSKDGDIIEQDISE